MNRHAIRKRHRDRKAAECREATDTTVASSCSDHAPDQAADPAPAKKPAKKPAAAKKPPRKTLK